MSWMLVAFVAILAIVDLFFWIGICGGGIHASFKGSEVLCPNYGRDLPVGYYLFDELFDLWLIILPMPIVSMIL